MTTNESIQDAAEKIGKHWVIGWTASLVFVSGLTWSICQGLYVAPRDKQLSTVQGDNATLKGENESLKRQLSQAAASAASEPDVTEKQGLAEGAVVISRDGTCQIYIKSVYGALEAIDITLSAGSYAPKRMEQLRVGERMAVGTCYADLKKVTEHPVDVILTHSLEVR